MTAVRKLLTIVVFTAAMFVATFGTSFFAMRLAFADSPAEAPRSDMGGSAAAHDPKAEHHHDPTTHFNFLGSPGEHYGKDITGGKYGDGKMVDSHGNVMLDGDGKPYEEEMSAPFIFMVLNFVLLLVLLSWKAKPAIEKLAADRHDQIKTALDEAAKLRKQAADRLDEYQSKLAKADAEIKAMIEGMRADAEADKKRILENADRQAAQMQKDADARIAAEIQLARTSLTREVTYAATAATEKLLKEKMTPSDQQQVISAFITGVQAAAQKDVPR
jgi:F-type H+-transporting ATPase subunit b